MTQVINLNPEQEFTDANWGDFYYPYNKNFKTPEDTLTNIVSKIKETINKSKNYIA